MSVMCQCPASGYSHFYYAIINPDETDNGVCQCPASGYSHFYTVVIEGKVIKDGCVNALHRATAISTFA